MNESLKSTLTIFFLVTALIIAVVFGMWQWHRAELAEARNEQAEVNVKLAQTQNVLSQLKFENKAVADAFRQVGYHISEPKTAKPDTAAALKRRGSQ